MKIACFSFTNKGKDLGERLKLALDNEYKTDHYFNKDVEGGIKEALKTIWKEYEGIVFISATGIALRMSAKFIEDKTIDPAIVVIDDLGRFSISLLSGHIGGGNQLARDIAKKIGALPVITTATDSRGIESIDLFAKKNDYYIEDIKSITKITSMMVNGESIGLYTEANEHIKYNNLIKVKSLEQVDKKIKGLIIVGSKEKFKNINIPHTILRPKNINIGIGCRRGISGEKILEAIKGELKRFNLSMKSIKSIGTIEVKKDEKGIIYVSEYLKLPLKIFTIKEIKKVEEKFSKSQFVKDTVGVYSVSAPVAFLQGGKIISEKSKHDGITISISKEV